MVQQLVSAEVRRQLNASGLKLAKVDPAYTSGNPRLVFDGETSTSGRTYSKNGNYTPAANDRVLVGIVNGTPIVICKFA